MVRTTFHGTVLEGFANSAFLEAIAAGKAMDLPSIINYLDVENGVRYQRKPSYAYDY